MASECLVIAVIILALSAGCFRAKRKNWGLAVLPLAFVPFAVGIGMNVTEYVLKVEYTVMVPAVIIMAALMVACLWIGITSQILIKTTKLRIPYVGVSVAFIFTLSLIMLFRYNAALGAVTA